MTHASEKTSAMDATVKQTSLRRPKTLPNLRWKLATGSVVYDSRPMKLTKLLLNVTVQSKEASASYKFLRCRSRESEI
ncbi:hypothetical protein LINPERHAP1_LOCUS10595 [Linum perenne]